jgi:hypothetical protein
MKQWSEFFELNESNTEEGEDGKEYQVKWICDNINDLDDNIIEKVYKLMKKESE